jgi:hypothetical protein
MTSAFDRARQAMQHEALAWVWAEIPTELRDSAEVVRHLLVAAAGADPSLGESPVYARAHSLLVAAGREQELQQRISAAYWNPQIRAKFGAARVEEAWRDPETALVELRSMSTNGTLPPGADQVLDTIYEAREFARENGGTLSGPPPAAAPIPTDPAAANAERKALIAKSIGGTLSKAENARLNALIAAGASADEVAAHRKALGVPAAPAERKTLIQKSVAGTITPAESEQLNTSISADIASSSGEGTEQ